MFFKGSTKGPDLILNMTESDWDLMFTSDTLSNITYLFVHYYDDQQRVNVRSIHRLKQLLKFLPDLSSSRACYV